MGQTFELLVTALFCVATVTTLLVVVGALFPRLIRNGREVAGRMPGRALLLGLVNTLFLGALVMVFSALASGVGVELLALPGLVLLVLLVVGWVLGLASVVELLGARLLPGRSGFDRSVRAGVIVVLASLTPFVGWFVLLPYLLMLGLGAVIIGFLQGMRPSTKSKAHPAEFE